MQFLDISARLELKTVALESVVGITSNVEQFPVETWQKIFPLLIKIAYEDKSEPLKKDAALALINLSANQEIAKGMLNHGDHSKRLVNILWKMIVECAYPSADPACMILCNLTIEKVCCDKVYHFLKGNGITMKDVVDQLCVEENSDEKKPKLHYLGESFNVIFQTVKLPYSSVYVGIVVGYLFTKFVQFLCKISASQVTLLPAPNDPNFERLNK